MNRINHSSRFIEMFGNPVTNTKSWPTKALSEVAPESPSTNKATGLVWVLNLDMVESQSGRVIEKVYDNVENLNSVAPFDDGNVLFSKLRPYLNKVVIPNGKGYATTELVPLRPKTTFVRKEFLACLLRSNDFVNYADAIATGTKMPRMPMTALRDFKCIIPPVYLQDEFIKVSQQADKSKFSGFKSRFIEDFCNKGYPSLCLNSFAKVITGSTPSRSINEYWLNGTHPWASAQDMGDKFVDKTAELITDSGMATCKLVPAGSLLYVCRGSIGVMSINRIDCATNQSICAAIPDGKICKTEYLYYWLLYHEEEISSLGEGTSFKSLSQKTFANLEIQLPPIDEQIHFIGLTHQADKSKYLN